MKIVAKSILPIRLTALLAVIGIAVLTGAIIAGLASVGAGTQNGEQIHGCVNLSTGALRVVRQSGQCIGNEYPLSWDQADAAPEIEIIRVTGTEIIETEDEDDSALVYVACPDGYTVVGGGAGRTFSVGNDRWFMDASSPRLPGDPGSIGDFAGWTASFETIDGEDAVGQYGFFAEALCVPIGD